MNNIFTIQNELYNIFSEIEENGGELTPELEEHLAITQDNFKNKVKGYCEYIKSLKADVSLIDEESKRLSFLRKTKQSTIDKLSSIVVNAIDAFGEENNKGVKYVDYGTGKVSIRRSKKVDVNDDYIRTLCDTIMSRLGYLEYTNQLETNDSIDVESLADSLLESEHIVVSKDDLDAVNADISFSVPLGSLMDGKGYKFVKDFIKHTNFTNYTVKPSVDKTSIKQKEDVSLHCAAIKDNKNIQIR